MNRLFEDATQRHSAESEAAGGEQDIESAEWVPAADVYERDNEYLIALDLPGIERESLDITVDKERLVIKGRRPLETEDRRRAERPHGRFLRKFALPSQIDQTEISAQYKDGELRITVPRRKEQQAGRVEIKVS